MGSTFDKLRTDTGQVWDVSDDRYEALGELEDAGNLTSGTLPDARIQESGVTQHGTAALEVPWSDTVVVEGDSSTRTTRATAVDSAIGEAGTDSKNFVFVPHDFLDYDASAVNFTKNGFSGRLVREGQIADVYDVKAYGAAGDDPDDGTGTDDIDALDAAATAAGADGIVRLSGAHTVGSTWVLPSNDLVVDFVAGHLVPNGDHLVLQTPASANRVTFIAVLNRPAVFVPGGVTHTSVGAELRCRMHTTGTFVVDGAGSHGIHFHQDSAGANLNHSQGIFSARNCGGDGVRIENTSGNPDDINGLHLTIPRLNSNNVGLRVLDGTGHMIYASADSNTAEGIKIPSGSGASNMLLVVQEDSSNGSAMDLAGGSGAVFGSIGSATPTDVSTSWQIFEGGKTLVRSTGEGSFTIENALANDGSESATLTLGVASGNNLKLRYRGDSILAFRIDGTNTYFMDADKLQIQTAVYHVPQDVRALSGVSEGFQGYHDGSGTNTVGPAYYNGTNWKSLVDGTTIS